MSQTQFSGMMLTIGAILGIFGELIRPGGVVVARSESPLEIAANVDALVSNPLLGHLSAEVAVIGLIFAAYGTMGLWGVFNRPSFGDGLIRGGVVLAVISLAGLALSNGFNHIIIHVSERISDDSGALADQALTIYTIQTGIRITSGFVYAIGYGVLGIGLAISLRSRFFRFMALGVGLLGIATSIIVTVAQHYLELAWFYQVSVVLGIPATIWFAILGISMFRQQPEFTQQPQPR